MSHSLKEIIIKPVTRIEGHAKVRIQLNDEGEVNDAFFHVIELRGFEKFLEGSPVEKAPIITPRICGICPVSHHLASAKACDEIYGVEIPDTAKKLRELMHMGQIIHSHSLHFFFLSAADFYFPENQANRNIVGLAEANPGLASKAIQIRAIGQKIIETTGARSIHPSTAIPGGVSKSLKEEERENLLNETKEALSLAEEALEIGKEIFVHSKDLDFIKALGTVTSYHMGLVKDGKNELYDGLIRVISPKGEISEFDPSEYLNHISEKVEAWSYMKFPYLKKAGYPEGIYRVNSLSRINVADEMATPKSQEALEEFREKWGRPAQETLLFNYARLIEIIYACERTIELLEDKDITGNEIRTKIEKAKGEGIGVIEAPRGTLIHHYKADNDGFLTEVNIIVATQQNNLAINSGIKQASKELISGRGIEESLLNKVEMVVRAYDPCLSCATHSLNQIPLIIEILDKNLNVISQIGK